MQCFETRDYTVSGHFCGQCDLQLSVIQSKGIYVTSRVVAEGDSLWDGVRKLNFESVLQGPAVIHSEKSDHLVPCPACDLASAMAVQVNHERKYLAAQSHTPHEYFLKDTLHGS